MKKRRKPLTFPATSLLILFGILGLSACESRLGDMGNSDGLAASAGDEDYDPFEQGDYLGGDSDATQIDPTNYDSSGEPTYTYLGSDSGANARSGANDDDGPTEGCDPWVFDQKLSFVSVNPALLLSDKGSKEWFLHSYSVSELRKNGSRSSNQLSDRKYLRSHNFNLPSMTISRVNQTNVRLHMRSTFGADFIVETKHQEGQKKNIWKRISSEAITDFEQDNLCGNDDECLERLPELVEIWVQFLQDAHTSELYYTFYTGRRGFRNLLVEKRSPIGQSTTHFERRVYHFIDRVEVRALCARRVPARFRPTEPQMEGWCPSTHKANFEKLSCEPKGPCNGQIPAGRDKNLRALPGYGCPTNQCQACSKCGTPGSVAQPGGDGAHAGLALYRKKQAEGLPLPAWHGSGRNWAAEHVTLKLACNLAGYLNVKSIRVRSWKSPGDNSVIRFDPHNKRAYIQNGSSFNRWSTDSRCKDLMHRECRDDSTWIFKK